MDPQHVRLDITQAPLLRGHLAHDPANDRWLLGLHTHHLIVDHTSLELLVAEVHCLLEDPASPLPAPLPFRDFVAQARRAGSEAEQRAFFSQELGDLLAPTAPFGLTDIRGNGADIEQLQSRLPTTLCTALRLQARRLDTSAASLFHLAYALMLAQASNQDDVVFGTALFGRLQGGNGADRVMGMFLNTLPIRLQRDGRSVVEATRQTQQQLAQLLQHEHATLALAQRCSGIEAPTPLFTALLNYRHAGRPAASTPWQGIQLLESQERTNYPLTLSVDDIAVDGSFALDVQVARHIGAERVLAMLLQAIGSLVQALETAPNTALPALVLLPAVERLQLQRFNATKTDLEGSRTLHRAIAAQARHTPDALAVCDDHNALSYAELDTRANQLAHHLIALGVLPEDRVAVCLPRSIDLMVALLAVLKAGAAYLPLDIDVPTARLEGMLADARPRVLLAYRDTHASRLARADLQTVLLDQDAAAWACAPTQAPELANLHPQHPAYVIYTSGSTGRPKGVVTTHAAIDNRLQWMQQAMALSPQSRVLQKTPVGFDVSVWELFWPLRVGACVALAQPGGHKDPGYLRTLIEHANIDTVHFVPSMLRVFLDAVPAAACSSLRRIVCSGEALPADLAQHARTRFPQARLYNLYGPTEAAVDVSAWECSEADIHGVPIGRPIANTCLHVCDARGQLAPIGVAGELQIAGVQLARGYLGRPDLTAERFVPDPFADQPGARMYRTGDLARWRADGALDYLGRNDQQVKLRGVRIELGEIEAALRACAGVREAAVLLREDTAGEPRLVAYVVGDAESLAADRLRTQLAVRLSEAMLPAAYVQLDTLPLTANGKLDRRTLPVPDADALATQAYAAPEGEREVLLASLWCDMLGIARIGRHDSFFALGGHSLLAITLIERLQRSGWQLDIGTLFSAPVLASLANALRPLAPVMIPANRIMHGCSRILPEHLPLVALTQTEVDAVVATVRGGAANVQDIYPLAPLQEGLLFHHLQHTDADPYLSPGLHAFDTREALDRFLSALDTVIARHDILRTAFVWQGVREPAQVVWRHAPLQLHRHLAKGHDALGQLRDCLDSPHARIDVQSAPLLHAHVLYDMVEQRWLLGLLHHHLVMDHTSLNLAIEEVITILAGQEDRLPIPVPFRDFVARARLEGTASAEAFFRDMLADIDQPTAPYGLLDVHGDGRTLSDLRLQLPATLAKELRRQAAALNMSVASLFHLAYALVVGRTAGCDDVVFGTTLFGRMHGGQGIDRVLGMFLNTLPLRLRLDGSGIADAARAVQTLLAQLMQHEHVSLALAQRCSGIAAPAPLFTALLNYRHAGDGKPMADASPRSDMHALEAHERTNYPLSLSVNETTEGFWLDIQTVAAIAPQPVGALMLEALQQIADALDTAPQTPLHALEILPAALRTAVIDGLNPAHAAAPLATVPQLFLAQAARTPHAIALIEADGTTLSYAELARCAEALARQLRANGLGQEARVAVCMPRGIALVATLFGVLHAGAVYVPLDPDLPSERLADILHDCRPAAVVVSAQSVQRLPRDQDTRLLRYEDLLTVPAPAPSAEQAMAQPANLAYLIYTSGSSGRPKGAMVEHRALSAYCIAAAELFGLSGHDCVLQQNAIGFDLSLEELLPALICGASLRLESLPLDATPTALQATALHLTSAHWHTLVGVWTQHPEQARRQLQNVRMINVTGDALSSHHLQQWHALGLDRIALIDTYGPTETAISCTAALLRHTDGHVLRVGIGKPLRHARIYVLDARYRPVPNGVIGELYVAGAQVGRGYHARPGLSAERFLPDPFAALPGHRMYRSGDLARWNADGSLDFLGRTDQQVKLRGFRVELGEIESLLSDAPGVRESAICVQHGSDAVPTLIAYVVADTLDPEALHAHLAARLPDYMLPHVYMRLDAMPLTPNRKLDRKALPLPDGLARHHARDHEPPRGPVEQTVATLWSEVLGCAPIGRNDDFFALGGHSLLAIRLASRLRSQFGIDIGLAEMFARPRLADFAACVATATENNLPPITPVARDAALPLSFAQQRLWFLAQLDPEADLAYLVTHGVRLHGALDIDALHKALDRIVARHETLRTRIVVVDGEPRQQILAEDIGFALQQPVLRTVGDVDAQVQRQAALERRTAFDPAGPLARGCLLQLGPQQHVLVLTLHHLVCDGWSTGVLIHELSTLYNAFTTGKDDPLPPLPLQYGDVAVWQRQWLDGAVLQRQLAYWQQRLYDAPQLLQLPTDHPRPPRQDFRGDTLTFSLPEHVSAALRALSQQHGVTPFMTLLAAWALLLQRYSGQSEVVIGTPLAGRDRTELEPLIGFFVNTVALRIDLSGQPSLAQLLQRVREAVLQAQAHQDLPFDRVIEAVRPARTLAHAPLCQAMFSSDTTPSSALELPGLQLQPLQGGCPAAHVDLAMEVWIGAAGINGTLTYASALFERSTLERHLSYYCQLLQGFADAVSTQVLDELRLAEPAQSLAFGTPAVALAQQTPSSLQQAFARQVARTPEAIAVRDGTLDLRYADLQAASDVLAQRLRTAGVSAGDHVVTVLPRSAALVIAQLAILKCGAAYVPLDPQQPARRLAQLVDDCAANVVVHPPQARPAWATAHCLPVDASLASDRSAAPCPAVDVPPNAVAYVMYTSGSTGVPKGVAITHAGVLNLVLAPDYAEWRSDDRFGFASNPAFDSTTLEVWAPLLCGACVVVVPQATVLDPLALADFVRTQAISVLILVAGVLRAYAPHLTTGLPTLRYLITGGDVADPRAIAAVLGAADGPKRLLQTYGPTEATQFATTLTLTASLATSPPQRIPLGQPIRAMQVRLLDARGNPVPIGLPGELHLAGPGVAQGYVGRAAETAERFVPDPYANAPGARMYRTGDLARWREDGMLDFLARADAQLKVRGFRIEPGEIEAALQTHPSVVQAVVRGQHHQSGQPRLLAYVVATIDTDLDTLASTLRHWLSARLPDYMQPAAYVPLRELPLTSHGKLDARALDDLGEHAPIESAQQPPQGEDELALARLWCELLGRETVGRHDVFFDIGGHSLLAVQLVARIQSHWQRTIAVSQLFDNATIASLAAQLSSLPTHADEAIGTDDRQAYLL
ncbi:non-ribosomal peptide synthetase [Xanthomonas maliensis]|uniref:non-ribosomal peptide synthetase n=3 Tax=Xanthomonas maliensis TaxID=1321368 RepID=UPI001264E5DC|nr:non-ribosomal peptide synthetase [Xanthomonas maliensis]